MLNTFCNIEFGQDNNAIIKDFLLSDKAKQGENYEMLQKDTNVLAAMVNSGKIQVLHIDDYIEDLIVRIKSCNADIIIIDYLQMISSVKMKNKARHEELKFICQQLKKVGSLCNKFILLNAQFNRQVLGKADLMLR